jgi:hypothetical protein
MSAPAAAGTPYVPLAQSEKAALDAPPEYPMAVLVAVPEETPPPPPPRRRHPQPMVRRVCACFLAGVGLTTPGAAGCGVAALCGGRAGAVHDVDVRAKLGDAAAPGRHVVAAQHEYASRRS